MRAVKLALLFAAVLTAAFALPAGAAPLPAATPDPAAAKQLEARLAAADAAAARGDVSAAASNLWRAAEIADRKLRDYATALSLYDRLRKEYPAARLTRGAAVRREYVARAIAAGEEPFRRFERVRAEFATLERSVSRDEVRSILEDHPDFPIADEALMWLADRAVEDGDPAEARRRYREIIDRFPQSTLVPHAWAGLGRAAFDEKDWSAAEAAYARIAQAGGAGSALVSRKEVEMVVRHRIRAGRLRWVLGFLGVVAVAAAVTVDPRRLRTGVRAAAGRELLYVGPLFALLVLIAPDEGRGSLAVLGASAILFLILSLLWVHAARPAFSRPALRVISTVMGTAAGAAVLYAVLYSLDLLVAVETLLGET